MNFTNEEMEIISLSIDEFIDKCQKANNMNCDKIDLMPVLSLREKLEAYLDNKAAENFNKELEVYLDNRAAENINNKINSVPF